MKTLDFFQNSLYRQNNSVKSVKVQLINVLKSIITGEWKDKVNAIRRYMDEGDMVAANSLKASLPCFTVAGVFKGGHAAKNLEKPTELVVLDFDHPTCLQTLRKICNDDPHTISSFQSPKDGLKVIVLVENSIGRHYEAYSLAREYYEKITGEKIDQSGSDVSRTCLVSYDPQGYIATLYDSFRLPDAPPVEESCEECHAEENTAKENRNFADGEECECFAGRESEFVDANLFLNPMHTGSRNQYVFKLACKAAESGCEKKAIYARLANFCSAPDFTKGEIIAAVNSAYQHVNSQNKKRTSGKRKTENFATLPLRHYASPTNEEEEEDAYEKGEEYRKNTPMFPEKTFEKIPNFLAECITEGLLPRERDTCLLSALVIFSAMTPCTWGKYDHKLHSPHLYAWVVAPSAVGKATAEKVSHMLDTTDRVITAESKAELKKYRKEKKQYELLMQHNVKAKEKVEAPDEPEEPPFKTLIIPATISNSRLLMQLHDNGAQGGIIFDSEAQTMTHTNKQDYGHIDTVLCKAWAHERTSLSFVSHGKEPVVCPHPHLAVLLTSTTTQVNALVENAEGGLPSRFLFYTYRILPKWKEMGGTIDDHEAIDPSEQLSEKAYRLFRFCESHPMNFFFSNSQWKRLNSIFSNLLVNTYIEGREDLQASVKRHAVAVMRIAMVLTRLDAFENNNSESSIVCPERFFDAAMSIALCCFEHSRLLFTCFEHPQNICLKNPHRKTLPLHAVPKRFTRKDMILAVINSKTEENEKIAERSVDRLLAKLIDVKIKRISAGLYEKLNV